MMKKLYIVAICVLTILMLVVMQNGQSYEEATATIYFQKDNRSMTVSTYLGNADDYNLSMNPQWAAGKKGMIYDLLTYAKSDRVVIWQPAGRAHGSEYIGVSQWFTLTEAQQQIMKDDIKKWKLEGRDRKVGIYISAFTNDPFTLEMQRNIEAFDVNNPTSLRWWLQTMLPYMNIGVDEFYLDAGASPDAKQNIMKLSQYMKEMYGITIGIEAIPLIQNASGSWIPDTDYLKYVPAIAFYPINPNLFTWKIPDEYEAHIILIAGLPINQYAHWNNPTVEQVQQLEDNGFIVGWNDTPFPLG